MSNEEATLLAVMELKQKGNQAYKDKIYDQAVTLYSKAIVLATGVTSDENTNTSIGMKMNVVLFDLHSNRCASLIWNCDFARG